MESALGVREVVDALAQCGKQAIGLGARKTARGCDHPVEAAGPGPRRWGLPSRNYDFKAGLHGFLDAIDTTSLGSCSVRVSQPPLSSCEWPEAQWRAMR
jgi:hypothetical protein